MTTDREIKRHKGSSANQASSSSRDPTQGVLTNAESKNKIDSIYLEIYSTNRNRLLSTLVSNTISEIERLIAKVVCPLGHERNLLLKENARETY